MGDVTIIGGGIIGLACAVELGLRGAKVRIFERGVLGAEATWAAAGMLAARLEAPVEDAMYTLSVASADRYPRWVANVEELAGIRVGLQRHGALRVAWSEDELEREWSRTAWQRECGAPIERLSAAELRALTADVADEAVGAVRFADQAHVEPRRLTRALSAAARDLGVSIEAPRGVHHLEVRRDAVTAVVTEDGERHPTKTVLLCAGAWSSLLDGCGLPNAAVTPVRGQMLALDGGDTRFAPFLWSDDVYLVPRPDGRIVVGSTTDHVGYDRSVTAAGIEGLLAGACRAIPALKTAPLLATWAGLRPGTSDERPLIGSAGIDGLHLATGHYRNGILLAPITAAIVGAQLNDEPPPLDVAAFDPHRRPAAPVNLDCA